MAKLVIGIFLLFFLAANFSSVSAKTPTLTKSELREQRLERIQELKEERLNLIEQKKEQIQEKIEVRRATQEARLTQIRIQNIKKFWERLKLRLLATIDRLERLIERMESRIAKIEAQNESLDTSEAQDAIEEAKENLDAAKAKLEATDINFEDLITSSDPKEAFKLVRETISDVKMDLVETHRLLVHAIGSLKGLRVGNSENVATPSAEPSLEPTDTPTATPTI